MFDETLARRIKFDLIERKDQRCKSSDGKTLSVARINAYISSFSQFCQWCIEHKIAVNLNVNPFKGLRIKHTKNSKTPRREFYKPEANAILKDEPQKKVEAKEFRDDAYWFIKIGLFSGMRLNETANLLLSDVVKKEGGKFGYGEKISRWFNRTVLRNIGIDKTNEKEVLGNLIDYHCVRHTFISQLKRLGVDMSYKMFFP